MHLHKADIDILFDPSYNIAELKTMSNKAKKTALSIVREALSTYEIDFLEKVVNGDAAVLDRISIPHHFFPRCDGHRRQCIHRRS